MLICRNSAHIKTQFISSVTGGPVEYSGGEMETVHTDIWALPPTDFQTIATHLDNALVEFDVR